MRTARYKMMVGAYEGMRGEVSDGELNKKKVLPAKQAYHPGRG
jgi:hypothetical protein